MKQKMKANVFLGNNRIEIQDKVIPRPGFNEALIRVTLTTICGTDLHILRGEYPVKPGLTIGHEPVGVIEELGTGLAGYSRGDRVLIGAITPCGQCEFCLSGKWSQCGGRLGGWKFGNSIDGCQAEYVLVPNAQANLAKIPDSLFDEDVVLLADIASTGISANETANVQLGDVVAVFAQGPIGLCATAGARLKGASTIIGVESDPVRSEVAKQMGADCVVDPSKVDVVKEIMNITGGRGVCGDCMRNIRLVLISVALGVLSAVAVGQSSLEPPSGCSSALSWQCDRRWIIRAPVARFWCACWAGSSMV